MGDTDSDSGARTRGYDRSVEAEVETLTVERPSRPSGVSEGERLGRYVVSEPLGSGRGRSQDAIEAFDRAGWIVEQAYGRTHEIMVAVVAGRGNIAAAAGHHQEASTWFETGAELAEAVYGPEHQMTQKFREGVAVMREHQSEEPVAGDEARDSRASRRE